MLFRAPFTSQPQYPAQLSKQYAPLAAVLPSGDHAYIISRGNSETVAIASGTSGIRVAPNLCGYGIGCDAAGSDSYRLHSVANQTNTIWEAPTDAVTVMCYFVKRASATNSMLFVNSCPNTSPYTAWGLNDQGSLRFDLATSTYTSLAYVGSTPENRPLVGFGVYDGVNMYLYCEGRQINSTAKTGTISYPNASNRGPSVGGFWDHSLDYSFQGDIFLCALWDRPLAPIEISHLSQNPWLVFDPLPRRIWLPSAATNPVLSSAAATNIAQTTADLQVTITFS